MKTLEWRSETDESRMPLITITVMADRIADTFLALEELRCIGARRVWYRTDGPALEVTVRAPDVLSAEEYVEHRIRMAVGLDPAAAFIGVPAISPAA
jgi:hypothetical protein